MLNHFPGEPGIALYLRRNRIQSVEEEMRLQLHPKGIQASLGKLPFQTLHAQLAGEVTPIVPKRLPAAGDQPVDKPVPQEHSSRVTKKVGIKQNLPYANPDQGTNGGGQVNEGGGEEQAQNQMSHGSARQLLTRKGQAAVDGDNPWRQQPPGPPLRQRTRQKRPSSAVGQTRKREQQSCCGRCADRDQILTESVRAR